MVKQCYLPGAGPVCEGNSIFTGRMPPTDSPGGIFFPVVMGVGDQQVRIAGKLNDTLVFLCGGLFPLSIHVILIGCIVRVGAEEIAERFVIVNSTEYLSPVFDPITKAEHRMVEVFCAEGDTVTEIEDPFRKVDVFDVGRKLFLAYGKIGIRPLPPDDVLQGVVTNGRWTVNREPGVGKVDRGKEGKADDVVPVGVG
jgi:hypothetical protein